MRKHPSSPIAPMRFPSCPVAFRLPPCPPLRLSRLCLGADRKRRGGRGSKEVGGGPAAPYLLRSTSSPPACPPQVVESRQLPGEGQGPSRPGGPGLRGPNGVGAILGCLNRGEGSQGSLGDSFTSCAVRGRCAGASPQGERGGHLGTRQPKRRVWSVDARSIRGLRGVDGRAARWSREWAPCCVPQGDRDQRTHADAWARSRYVGRGAPAE